MALEEEDGDLLDAAPSAAPQEWRLVATLRGHAQSVLGVAFTAAGDRVLSCSRDGAVRAWQAEFGDEASLKARLRPVPCRPSPAAACEGAARLPGRRF